MSQSPLRVSIGGGVVVNVLSGKHNKVVGRIELFGEVIHLGGGTPRRSSLKEAIAIGVRFAEEAREQGKT